MGMDASGIFCFGVIVGEEEGDKAFPWPNPEPNWEEFEEDNDDGDEGASAENLWKLIAKEEHGAADPYSLPGDEWRAVSDEAKDAYRELTKKIEATAPIDIIEFGTENYDRQIIVIQGTVTTASEYGATKVERNVTPSAGKIEEARVFCEKWKLHPFEDPTWIVAARYW